MRVWRRRSAGVVTGSRVWWRRALSDIGARLVVFLLALFVATHDDGLNFWVGLVATVWIPLTLAVQIRTCVVVLRDRNRIDA